jgi:DNA-directed RNA polymerase specialized sigma subunit
MPNAVDRKIDEITQEHVRECEKLNVSRNVVMTAQRVAEALKAFSAIEILASGHWEGQHDAAKTAAIRNAVLELSAKVEALTPKPAPAKQVELEEAIEAAPPKKSARGTKGKVLA